MKNDVTHASPQFQKRPEVGMPKSCISCSHYQVKGYDQDDYCPFKDAFTGQSKQRTQFGVCGLHRSEVFATEICNSYSAEPYVVPIPVFNRPSSRSGLQERLNLSEASA